MRKNSGVRRLDEATWGAGGGRKDLGMEDVVCGFNGIKSIEGRQVDRLESMM